MFQVSNFFQRIRLRTYLLGLTAISMIGGIVSLGFFIYFLTDISTIVKLHEASLGSQISDVVRATRIFTVFLLIGIGLALVHMLFSSFPLLAEFQNNPRWLIPWIGYLYVSLAIGIFLAFGSILCQDFVSSFVDIAGITFTYVALILSSKRRKEMEVLDHQNFPPSTWL